MKPKLPIPFVRLGLVVLGLAALSGCATVTGRGEPRELERRASVRWQHLIAGQAEKAYPYLTPGVRSVTDVAAYKARVEASQVRWTEATVESADCPTEEKCTVSVKVNYDLIGGLPGVPELSSVHMVRETWLKLDGKWYFLPRDISH